jgi:OOP family OmpA-OmpF porin
MKNVKCLAASILALSTSISHAGGYVGLSVGQSNVDLDGFDDATSIALTGGYKINKNFAVEASYVDLGESKDDTPPVWTLEADGFNFSAVGIIPASEKIDIFAKIGMFMWDATLEESGFGELASDDGTDISFGVGASVNLTDQFGLLLEFQKFDLDSEDVSNISLGIRLNF